MKQRIVVLILAMAMVFVVSPGSGFAAGETLVVVQEAEPVGLDIMQSSIQTTMSVAYNINDTLLKPQENATVKPGLAEKWEKIDDLTWKFTLIKGATFHNGEPINAAAVKFSFDRIMSDSLKSPHKGKLNSFKEVNVLDDRTFTISLNQPYAPGLYMLAQYLFIVPPGYINKVGDAEYNLNPVGSGAYKLDKWIKGQEIILSAYDKYYGKKPAYKKLVFKGVPEESSRVASLLTGEADVISGIPVHQRKKIVDSGKAYLTDQMGSMNYLGLNTYEKPFSDVKVRQAVNYAINRPLINKALFDGKAILCVGPISPRTFGANTSLKPYTYSVEKAKKLLAEAGYPNGFETRLAYGTYMPQIQEQAEAIASDLGKVGIKVILEPFERAVMWDRYKKKMHQMYIYFWDDAPEPDRYMYSLFHSKSRDYYYKNATVDELLDKGRTTINTKARAKVYNELDQFLYNDAPWVYLYVIPEVYAVSNAVDYRGLRDGYLIMNTAKPKK
jgi:peptide/nickel transport system substrate-binding protein